MKQADTTEYALNFAKEDAIKANSGKKEAKRVRVVQGKEGTALLE